MRGPLIAVFALAWLVALPAACKGSGEAESPPTVTISPIPSPTATPTPVAEAEVFTPQPTQPAPVVDPPEIESLEYLSADVPVPALPSSFAAPVADAGLQQAITSALSPYEGQFSVVVHNLEDGRSASIEPGRVYYAASLFKMALLLEAYRQRDAGEVDFSELQTLTEEYAEYDLNTLEALELEIGDQLTLADAIKAMIVVSDTPTAVMVQDIVNPVRVDQTLRSLGITDMSVTTHDLPTTARDMATLMKAVAAGAGVSEESRREMLALLLQESYRAGIPAGVPAGTPVAHKTGNVTNASHDVALVWSPGGPYVIAVLSDRSWEAAPIAAVSSAVWDYFAAHP